MIFQKYHVFRAETKIHARLQHRARTARYTLPAGQPIGPAALNEGLELSLGCRSRLALSAATGSC